MDVKTFQKELEEFLQERDWRKYHQPKDLLLGIVEEVGEFRNLIKWEQDNERVRSIVLKEENRKEVKDFFRDMMWFLSSLANYCKVDIEEVLEGFVELQAKRFPVGKVKGTIANPKSGGYDLKYMKKD
jgi:NTP pyrophosphatase (non-canonical NTP hydrolase)